MRHGRVTDRASAAATTASAVCLVTMSYLRRNRERNGQSKKKKAARRRESARSETVRACEHSHVPTTSMQCGSVSGRRPRCPPPLLGIGLT